MLTSAFSLPTDAWQTSRKQGLSDADAQMRLFSEDSYISIDYQKKDALIYKKSPELTLKTLNITGTDVSSIADLKSYVFGDLLKIEHIKMDDYEPLKKELESFVQCIVEHKRASRFRRRRLEGYRSCK